MRRNCPGNSYVKLWSLGKVIYVLGKIWKLSDVDMDGFLDSEEFALAMHLVKIKSDGHDLPSELPKHLVPPSKRSWSN